MIEIEEYVDWGSVADEVREALAQEALNNGFVLLAKTIDTSNDIEEVMAAAELDLIEMGVAPNEAALGVSAGCIAYKACSVIRGTATIALQPEVEDEQ